MYALFLFNAIDFLLFATLNFIANVIDDFLAFILCLEKIKHAAIIHMLIYLLRSSCLRLLSCLQLHTRYGYNLHLNSISF